MRLYAEQLDRHLQTGLRPCYLLFGDEPLLKEEALQALLNKGRDEGFSEYHPIAIESSSDWGAIFALCQSLSLFAQRTVVHLVLPAKFDRELAPRLLELAELLHGDLLLVLSGDKLTSAQQKVKWFERFEQQGVYLPLNTPDARHFPRWIAERLRRFDLSATPEAINYLCHVCEGNLFAARQEIEKLALLEVPQPLRVESLQKVVTAQNYYTPFQWIDALLEGKVNRARRILVNLRQEGVEPGLLIWNATRELAQLQELAIHRRNGENLAPHFNRLRLWAARQELLTQAIARLSLGKFPQLWALLAECDEANAQFLADECWETLHYFTLGFRDAEPLPLPREAL